ncbi:MAG: hypothetical protein WBM50_15200 [Acidimicrobiales bacterium]
MLSTKPIDPTQLTFRYSGAAEHYEYDRDTQKRTAEQTRDDDTGYLLWKVRCVAVYREAGEHGEITVTVPHPQPPAAEFDSEIAFTGMTVKDWSMNGNQGQTWHAQSFQATRPSAPPSSAGNGTGSKKTAAAAN